MAETETILVVDDEPMVLEFVSAVLLRSGYEVIAAPQPREALALLRDPNPRIDLLLTDVVMPDLNGVELAREAVAARPAMRVAFMSGQCGGLPAEFSGCEMLRKPFLPADLVHAIGESLATERAPA